MTQIATARFFLLFIMMSFVGWVSEVIYCSIPAKHFINRGMLHGPICPIYGFGGIIVAYILKPLENTWIPLFFASMILCSAVEYFGSWLLEILFHTKWWDYSKHKFNIKGRVCLLNSTLFGLMGMLCSHFVLPFMFTIIDWLQLKLTDLWFLVATNGLLVILLVDMVFTVRSLVDFNRTMAKVNEFAENLKERFAGQEWFQTKDINSMISSVKEHAASGKEKFSASFMEKLESFNTHQKAAERWLKNWPTMTSKANAQALEHLKNRFEYKKLEMKVARAQKKAAKATK